MALWAELIASIINFFRDLKQDEKCLPASSGGAQLPVQRLADSRDAVIVGLTLTVIVLALTVAIVALQRNGGPRVV